MYVKREKFLDERTLENAGRIAKNMVKRMNRSDSADTALPSCTLLKVQEVDDEVPI